MCFPNILRVFQSLKKMGSKQAHIMKDIKFDKRFHALSADLKQIDTMKSMESYLEENNSKQDDSLRHEIRAKLSKMSFEDLQKLKAKLGDKVLKEAVFGAKFRQTEFIRKNKNRPQEVSSKIKPTSVKKKVKGKRICDPRFDRLCGTFNEKHFQNTYGFISDIKKHEKIQLKKILKKTVDPVEADKMQYLIQRMENQEQEKKQRHKKQEMIEKERQEQINALKIGKKAYFRTKYEKKIVQLVDKYSDLKNTGKIKKYIEKKQIKHKIKEKQKRYFNVKLQEIKDEQ